MKLAEYIWIDGTEPSPQLRSKTKVIPNNNINISILNSRWDSMNRISKLLEKEFTKKTFVNKIDTYKINHSEPTEEDLLNHVTDWSHFAILGLAN